MNTKLNSAAELITPVTQRPSRHVAGKLLWLMLSCRLALAAETAWAPNDIVQAEQLGEVELSPVDPNVVLWVKAAPNKEKDELVRISSAARGVPGRSN